MTAIQAAQVAATDGCQLFRSRKDAPGEYDVKPYFTGRKSGWVALDSFSASAIVAVWNGLNETNREKYAKLPIQRMAAVAFKLVEVRR